MIIKFPQVVSKNRKLQALDCVQFNYSFAIAVNNKKFKQMFPDSKIAQSYKQGDEN